MPCNTYCGATAHGSADKRPTGAARFRDCGQLSKATAEQVAFVPDQATVSDSVESIEGIPSPSGCAQSYPGSVIRELRPQHLVLNSEKQLRVSTYGSSGFRALLDELFTRYSDLSRCQPSIHASPRNPGFRLPNVRKAAMLAAPAGRRMQ
jgi:hypothetical protein